MPKSTPPTTTTTTKSYSEIDDIRQDLDSLKNNVVELTRHLTKDGNAQVAQLGQALSNHLADLQKSGKQQYKQIEGKVKEKPAQTLAIAFGAGVLASLLLGRR